MKTTVQKAGVYLATTKETFGIGILEAMASGVPILGYAHGGILPLVEHGVNGYLANPGDLDDLADGLDYCITHADMLGNNGREMAKAWTWEKACAQVAETYKKALEPEPPTVAIIIPTFNYGHKISAGLTSAISQTYKLTDIVVVDDGSDDNGETNRAVQKVIDAAKSAEQEAKKNLENARNEDKEKLQLAQRINANARKIRYVRQQNQGVAIARNTGISNVNTKYVCCLDADDQISPTFIETLVPDLEADRSLGVAYTSLILRSPKKDFEGKWPNEFDFDKQVNGGNQIPTCCLFRREAWERTGGYRQRYAPDGCGTEDAEFWLRLGSIGYTGKKVSDKRLFIYNSGGYTTGTKGYKEIDWLQWHPWVYTGLHPFASVATPEKLSHPVRQYDEPIISVIIPVGPGHELNVLEALDSVEAQTIHNWEAIIVWDTPEPSDYIKKAYPYARFIAHTKTVGAGAARNAGARLARAPFLLFLDADDWLLPSALEQMIQMSGELDYEAIIYSESLGTRAVDVATAEQYKMRNELVSYDRGIATVRQPVSEYEYNGAIAQPFTQKPYFWCYITSLIPTTWHHEIGGFDEKLPAWEDWDYWMLLAKKGKPFVHINEPLMVYSYDSGARREEGQAMKDDLQNYLRKKHEEIKVTNCKHCDSKKVPKMRPSRQQA
jgi:glycosyltransferase involved in cell wall biosynthesis